MRGRRRPAPAPPAGPEALFAAFGALEFAVVPGAFAYVLGEPGERGATRWFYAGETEHLLRRLGDWADSLGWAAAGGRVSRILVFPCRDRHQARVTQFALIDRLGLENLKGTAGYEEWRRTRRAAAIMDLPARVAEHIEKQEGRAS